LINPENDCVPVKVCPASVLAIVAVVVGNVITVESVPERVIEFVTASVLPAVMFNVFVPLAVIVRPLVVVGVIAPSVNESAPSELDADTPLPVVTLFTRVPVVAGSVWTVAVPAAAVG
jgi:hypothetical protein